MSNTFAGFSEEFVSLGAAPDVAGVSGRALGRLIDEGTIQVYGTARDARRRFVRKADLEGLAAITPTAPIRRRRRIEEGAAREETATAS